ncbi:MAG TPA: hypothetical protein VFL95_06490 [Gemmatimonadales bacterium]|nr:hypothetical protein [Gemmatimonadales bacterium]
MLTRWWLVLGLVLVPAAVHGQDSSAAAPAGLREAAEEARQAWQTHDLGALVASSPRVLVQLPGADPATALGRAQAEALLRDYLAPTRELGVEIRAAREVEPGRGYVELARRYQVEGTQEVRTQTLLLSFREGRAGWALVELRVVG